MDKQKQLTNKQEKSIVKFYDEWIGFWNIEDDNFIQLEFPEVYSAVVEAEKAAIKADLLCESMRKRVEG